MGLLLWIVFCCAVGGILSVLAASWFLLLPEQHRQWMLPYGVSFATGALLAVAFGGLIPHAFAHTQPAHYQALSGTILAGVLGFFIVEKLLIWRHCHDRHHPTPSDTPIAHREYGQGKPQSVALLIMIGDGIHNFVDGMLIAAAFLTDIKLGIATSLAAATHEIPQEIGDFAILLAAGYSPKKALAYNILASLTTILGGILGYFSLDGLHDSVPYFLALAASSFIYVAIADLIPSLHQKTDLRTSMEQIALILAGILLIGVLQNISHDVDF